MKVAAGMKYAMLNPILEELVREGKIRITGERITLIIIESLF